jgi:formate dehydrogenase subunit gamma
MSSIAHVQDLSQRMIKKHHVAIILLHWFNAFIWLVELTTGAALIRSDYFRFAPVWFITMISEVFGTRANLLRFHIAAGLTWITVFAVYGIFGWRTYLHQEVLKKEVALDRDDWLWIWIRLLRTLGRSNEPLPPQGIYNAGQKLFALAIYAMVPIIMITGLIMACHWGSMTLVGWAVVIHFLAVSIVVSGLMIHVYMGAVFPEEKPAFFSMITGTVNEEFAHKHHHKWWKEVKLLEQERGVGQAEEPPAQIPAAPPPQAVIEPET